MRLHDNDIPHLEELFRQGRPCTQVEVAALFDYIARLEERQVPFDWMDHIETYGEKAYSIVKKPRGVGLSAGRGGQLPGPRNIRPYPRSPRTRHFPVQERYRVRFGSRAATALLLLELHAAKRITNGFDAEWYEGEFLYRLRVLLFEKVTTPAARSAFDWDATLYQYETIDLSAVINLGKRAYLSMLLCILGGLYAEEAIGGPITEAVRRRFHLPRFLSTETAENPAEHHSTETP